MESNAMLKEDLERELRERLSRGDVNGATELALRGYGPEILAFLVALHRDEDSAGEVFSTFTEALWRGMAGFAGRSTLRTWAYGIARRASLKHRRNARRRAARFTPIAEGSDVARVAEMVRTETLPHLRSTVKSRIVALRESLAPEDQELLMLRIDRQLAWNELALVMAEGEAPLEGEDLKRASARLRKRFQAVKEKLREMARREGLVAEPEER
jgi:RNA polymerase sigma-70 factor (ECF subfamily)